MNTSTAAFLGILSLDTAFPRIVGDAGNPDSYPFPVRVRVVGGADSPKVVVDGVPEPGLVEAFIHAAKELEIEGAAAIVSTCGFLISVQKQIAGAVNVPVMLSALSLYPVVSASLHDRPVGVLTASEKMLGKTALAAAGIPSTAARIAGLDDIPAFSGTFLVSRNDQPDHLNTDAIQQAVVEKANSLLHGEPEIGAFLLECGNLPPYAGAIRRATGKPVFHLLDAAQMLWSASARK